ncbi:MAG: long-chain fatty acid--CoA ligase, partial [Varibaculum timonense]
VLKALERAVGRAHQKVSRAESIRKIRVLTTDFSLENGTMTPSLKVKRSVVIKRFENEINAIYGGPLEQE